MAYTVHQAKTQFSKLLREAEAGKEVIVTRGAKPVAKIVPIADSEKQRRTLGGFEHLGPVDDGVFDPLTDEQMVEYGFGVMVDGKLVEGTKDFDLPADRKAE